MAPLLSVLLMLTLGTSAPQQPGVVPEEKTAPAPYLLAADDTIDISVINFPELSAKLIVPPDGQITVRLLPQIAVTGMTTTDLTKYLTEKWRRYVVDPSITVVLVEKRKETVLFYGFIEQVGTIVYRPGLHLIEALAELGGAKENGDLKRVKLTRRGGGKQTLDISRPETRGGTPADIVLEPGDVLYIPEKNVQVSILGEVTQPGSFAYKEDATILELLKAAGNIKESADLAGATLLRDGKETPLDLESLLHKGDLRQNLTIEAGDRILIPEIRNRTYIFGAVNTPGYYNFKIGDRILDALKSSGGATKDADFAKITVIQMSKARDKGGKASMLMVDIGKIKKGDLSGNVALEPGDVVFVPDRKRGFQLNDVMGLSWGISGIQGLMSIFTGRIFR